MTNSSKSLHTIVFCVRLLIVFQVETVSDVIMSWLADAFKDAGSDDKDEEEVEQMEEMEQSRLKRQKTSKVRTKQSSAKKKTRQWHVLNKEEKLRITGHTAALKEKEITVRNLSNAAKQLAPVSDSLKQFTESLSPSQLLFLARHLKVSFVRIYNDCSTLKECYLQFQLKWHEYCSHFLVTKNSELSAIGLHPANPIANKVVSIRAEWRKVCDTCR